MINNIGNNKGLFAAIGKTISETYNSGEAFGEKHYSAEGPNAPPADRSEAAARRRNESPEHSEIRYHLDQYHYHNDVGHNQENNKHYDGADESYARATEHHNEAMKLSRKVSETDSLYDHGKDFAKHKAASVKRHEQAVDDESQDDTDNSHVYGRD